MEPVDNIRSLINTTQCKEAIDKGDINLVMKMEYNHKILTRANTLKTEGNTFFKEGNYCMAIKRYEKALQCVSHVRLVNEGEAHLMEELAVSLNSNISECWLKLNEFELARNQCTSALKLNTRNIEVLYTRAVASLNLGLVNEAYIDLQEAHRIEPTNLDVLFELKSVEKMREGWFSKSAAGKGKGICEVSVHHCKGNTFFGSPSLEVIDRSLGRSTICSTSKLMEEVNFNPSLSSNCSKKNLINVKMDCKTDYRTISSSLREVSMGYEKTHFICSGMKSGLSSLAKEDDINVKKMFRRYSLRKDSRFFLKIRQNDYEKLCWGSELKYFSSHNMVVITIRVLNRSLSSFKGGHIGSGLVSTSFVSNALILDDLCDLGGQEGEDPEWDELFSKEMGIDGNGTSEIDMIEEKPYMSSRTYLENTFVKPSSTGQEESHQAPFRFTSRGRKCRRCKPQCRKSLCCRLHYNVRVGSKRKWLWALSSEACRPACKKAALDHTCDTGVLPVGTPSEGSLSNDLGSFQTRPSKPLKKPINSEVYELKDISKDLVDDLERPLVTDDYCQVPSQRNGAVNHASEGFQTEGGSLVPDLIDQLEDDISIGQTLKRTSHFAEKLLRHCTKEDLNNDPKFKAEDVKGQEIIPTDRGAGICLSLEVITGPACGHRHSVLSTDDSKLPLTLGRVPPCDLVLKDSEVSGKHAMINWNPSKLKWELVDMGSLNGTLLNSKAVHHPDSGSRRWGEPKELVSGDVITLGTTSQLRVQVTSVTESEVPFGVGIASDPMSMRRGGKKLPMEDVCYYRWPLPGADQFGVFGISDGHGGALAAKSVSNILPKKVATILSDLSRRQKVLSRQDASDVLSDAFFQTEACLNHYYEGCTATVLLVWRDGCSFCAQCANVGDSACVININGKQIKMTEDHRISNYSERQRINETGEPLKDGDTRLCGLNLGRMLGDKFLKEQDARFSSKPYISQVIHIDRASNAFALLASDGLWDVIGVRKAIQLVLQAKERYLTHSKDSAEKIANFLLNEAKTLRTKDNTSVLYIDFETAFRT